MITAFRRYLETWVVRGFFLIMVLSFVSWGVGDVIRLVGTSTWAAKVGGQTIEGVQLQEAYQREMAQVTRNLPAGQEPTQDMRSGVAREALQQLITQAALNQELQRLHIVTPDQVVRQTVFAMPAFRGPNGHVRSPDVRDAAAQQRPDRGALPRHDARRSGAAAVARRGQCRHGNAGGAAAPAVSGPVREALRRHGGIPARRRARTDRARPRPSCSAGTTTIPICIPRRNTAGSRRSCCRRRRWRRTSRSPTPTCRQPTSSARRST